MRLFEALPDGRRQVLDFLAGDCFALIGLDCHAYSVEAIVQRARHRYPRHLSKRRSLATRTSPRLCSGSPAPSWSARRSQILLLGRKTAEERIASFLLRLAATGDGDAEHRSP